LTSLNSAWTTGQVATVTPSPPIGVSLTPDVDAAPTPAPSPQSAAPPIASAVAAPVTVTRSALDTLKAVAAELQSYVNSNGRELEFRVDESSGLTVVTVRNSQTGDLIRQIPSDEAVRIARALGSNGRNALVDLEA